MSADVTLPGLLSAMFLVGLTGGVGHCVGMCGPVVLAYSMWIRTGSTFLPHLLYHAGRISTYAMLGAVLGLLGSFTSLAGDIVHAQKVALVAAGVLMIAMGLSISGVVPAWVGWIERLLPVSGVIRKISGLFAGGTSGAFYPMGVVLGFIPCGLVYSALIAAAGAGVQSAGAGEAFFSGMLVMLAFGAGTVPALLLFGVAARSLSARGLGTKLRSVLYRLSGAVVIASGLILIWRGLQF